MDDFTFLSESDKGSVAYGVCVAAQGGTGALMGRFFGLHGLLVGAAAGVAWGLLTCPYLKEPLEQRIFSSKKSLTETELLSALRTVRRETGAKTKDDAMYLLGAARAAHHAGATPPKQSSSTRAQAQLLLHERA